MAAVAGRRLTGVTRFREHVDQVALLAPVIRGEGAAGVLSQRRAAPRPTVGRPSMDDRAAGVVRDGRTMSRATRQTCLVPCAAGQSNGAAIASG
ncbi:hypothetical protein QFZ32_008900 [Streptomyces canus]|nr:hypothetical protein [Streptomyces canus]